MARSSKLQGLAITDEQIIELYWQRNEKAIQETERKYGKRLWQIAFNILHDTEDCEECLNDTYFGTWNAIPPNRPNLFSSFVFKIMRNHALNKYKEKARLSRIPSELTVSIEDLYDTLHSTNSPESELSAKELGKLINQYLDSLTERQRYVFIGRFYMGDTLDVIAKQLNVHLSTVQRETVKIKKGLKAYLERNGEYV